MESDPGSVTMKNGENESKDEKQVVCRVCVRLIEGKYYTLFEKYNGLLTPGSCLNHVFIADRIRECANVNITQNDGLPDFICYSCLFELEDAYNFKRKCEKSDEILRIKSTVSNSCNLGDIPVHFEAPVVKEESDADCTGTSIRNYEDDQDFESSLKNIHADDFSYKEEVKHEESLSPPCSEPDEKDVDRVPKQVSDKVKISRAVDLKLECNECGKLFKSKCKIRVHIKKEHSTFTCPICKLIFKTWHAFDKHRKVRTKRCLSFEKVRVEGDGKFQIFYCKECDYNSKTRANIVNHVVVHTKILNFKCGLCNLSFMRRNALRYHEERDHKKLSRAKVCHKCGAFVVGYIAYCNHMKNHRRVPQIFQCDLCNKIFTTRPGILVHLEKHSDMPNSCDICPKSFRTRASLYRHKTLVHAAPKYICKICGFQYKKKSSWEEHERKHNCYSFACLSCGKFLSTETELEDHTKNYHVYRPFVCVCNKTYKSKKDLARHVRTKHKKVN